MPQSYALSLPLILLGTCLMAQSPNIDSLTLPLVPATVFGKWQVAVHVSAGYTNPYDYEQISVQGHFVAPDGGEQVVDGFYMQAYELTNPTTGAVAPTGQSGFFLRFAPRMAGVWSYRCSVTTPAGADTTDWRNLTVAEPEEPTPGFVRASNTNYLQFDDGSPFVPIGENIAWPSGNTILSYPPWLEGLRDSGGNFFRLWQCHWGLGLEWINNGYQGLMRYHQQRAFLTDWLFDYAAERGIYVLYCLQHHGQVATEVNPNWWENPYNADNGGPCLNTWDFFTNEEARRMTKNRYRYVVARWGYNPAIMAWELFNEVDWTDEFDQRRDEVANWHLEMAAYLKSIDPYQHLVSTSYARTQYDPLVWNSPDIDFTQTHHYFNSPNLERTLAGHTHEYLDAFAKPTLNAEFGLSTAGNQLDELDPTGIHLHNCLWGTFFGGAMGPAMTWWWDSYVHPQNLYHHFSALSAHIARIDLINGNFRRATVEVDGPAADLIIDTQQGWGSPTADEVLVDAAGNVSMQGGPGLGLYLYGSQWNTQLRNPPTFVLDLPQATEFTVITGNDASESPIISIFLDGTALLTEAGEVNTSYTITVPAGQHQVMVDNTGTDWIQIAAYRLGGLGQAVDGYVLRDETGTSAHGWLLNNAYNHQSALSGALPEPAAGVVVNLEEMANGAYLVQYFDCLSGGLVLETTATAQSGVLSLFPPALAWDLSFTASADPVATRNIKENDLLAATVFPNPAIGGRAILSLELAREAEVRVSLRDAAGRSLARVTRQDLASGWHELPLELGNHCPSGTYWLQLEMNGGSRMLPLVIVQP